MTAPKVSAVVLNWNCGEDIVTCVQALNRSDHAALSIMVVDNGSTDGSAERVGQLEFVDVVTNGRNLGFTGGVNVGLRRSLERGADYVWLMNSDAVPDPAALSRLIEVAEADPRIGLLTPLIRDVEAPHAVSWCLGRFNTLSRQIDQTTCPATASEWQRTHPREVIAPGTALLVRRTLIEKIGVLDDTFFAYVEDVDYSLRSTSAGFRNVFVEDAVVYHTFKRPLEDPSGVPPHLHYLITRNYPLLWRKLPGPTLLDRSTIWYLRERFSQLARMTSDTRASEALLAGLWDGLIGQGGPYDRSRRMPWPMRPLLRRYAKLLVTLIDRLGRSGK